MTGRKEFGRKGKRKGVGKREGGKRTREGERPLFARELIYRDSPLLRRSEAKFPLDRQRRQAGRRSRQRFNPSEAIRDDSGRLDPSYLHFAVPYPPA
jgi:hypothetical protein